MRYKFRKLDFWEELKAVVDKPANITDSGEEMVFDFGDYILTPQEEGKLKTLMENKPMLRGKLATFIEKGATIEITPLGGRP